MISSLTMAEFHQLRELDGGLRFRRVPSVVSAKLSWNFFATAVSEVR
jgi:hypothetical protein